LDATQLNEDKTQKSLVKRLSAQGRKEGRRQKKFILKMGLKRASTKSIRLSSDLTVWE
jgi:hypothetical protein